jgi:N-acetylglucosamine-6-phosphate deacetylase
VKRVWIGNVVLPDRILYDGQIIAEDGKIVYVGEQLDHPDPNSDLVTIHPDGYLWPGLIDIHVHGSGGSDTMDGTAEALSTISKSLLSFGVTGYLPTTMTMGKERIAQVLSTIASWKRKCGEAEILGVHLEGPWISPKYKGAQNPEYILPPRKGDGKWVFEASQGMVKIVTLAPEQGEADAVIQELTKLGIQVSIGHSDATYEEVEKAVKLGARHITHTFNASRGLHHREPGVVGAALALDELYCELIADGFHVHPNAVRLLIKVKGKDRVILISDGIRAVGLPDGESELGGLKVWTKDGKATLEDGTLAGSLLTLNRAVINAVRFADIPIWEAVQMASLNPAKRLGLDHSLGSIEVGKRANIVAVDGEGSVNAVWIDGIEQFRTS